jgi:putative NADH-flavin reductase
MTKIVVFGAGGRAGRHVVREAVFAGHEVTAIVRDPAKYADLAGHNVVVAQGDVTNPEDVATLSSGHDVAVSAVARMDMDATEFYSAAARALIEGLGKAGVARVVLIGIGTTLVNDAGVLIHDTDGFPAEGRAFSLGHAAELEVFASEAGALDWLVLAPPPVVLDDVAPRTGEYRIGGRQLMDDAPPSFSYADLAVAVIDEVVNPKHHRVLAAVAH